MKQPDNKGRVIIAGAGPGDPELLTLKAFRFLQKADVIITDRLVSGVILEEFTRKDALVLHVGKQHKKGASTPQSIINELLVEYALQGKLVVRLKGGDVSIFSNILDELQTLSDFNIPYEIIPGITAASGAAAASGIPLTARGYSTAVRFLTCYRHDLIKESYWMELAKTDDTLVFYMSSDGIASVVENLLKHGAAGLHMAVIEQATTPFQQVYHCRLEDYHHLFENREYASPTLLIIGKVAALHQHYRWQEQNGDDQSYFKPLAEKRYIPAIA